LRFLIGPKQTLVHTRVLPQLARDLDWVNAGGLPPSSLVAGAMDGTVMGTAERYSELIARLAAERLRLHVSKMMRVGWLAATDEACLLGRQD
jgi:hypothetical protein